MKQFYKEVKSFVLATISKLLEKILVSSKIVRNACIFNTCLVSATNVDVLIKNVKILVADLEEEKKKKKTSVKESRKTAINEEIKLLKNAIAGKQKETERERERVVVEKSLLMRWRNLEICKEICRF